MVRNWASALAATIDHHTDVLDDRMRDWKNIDHKTRDQVVDDVMQGTNPGSARNAILDVVNHVYGPPNP